MYHPPDQSPYLSDDLEFLELQNIGSTPLSIGGLTFTAGITFTFTNGTTLAPGQRFLLGRNATALQAKYPGLAVHGIYSGKLDNAGETIRLSTPTGVTVLELTYGDASPWPVTADGMGWSLVLDDPVSGRYRVSSAVGGSPGAVDPAYAIPPIVINELLTHTDLPQVDTIELRNPTAVAVNVGGWFLSDDKDVPKKFRIPNNTIISAGGYLVFNQTQYDTQGLDFNLNSLGDEVYLFSGDAGSNLTGYVHEAPFGAAANGVSFGRYVNSVGSEDFVALSALTFNATNARPLVGPVVITEIMFQPAPVGTNENYADEFIELQNVAATNVPLYASLFPTNTWRLGNAVSFNFPTNVTLPVGGRLVVVGFDPKTNAATLAAFRATYSLTTNTPIYGPWAGRLDNSGEAIELKFPDAPELDGFVPYIMGEKVSYRSVAPWPEGAAGTGQSLQRGTLLAYANDPVNWYAGPANAGGLGAQTSDDVDGDGMPDLWEMWNGLAVYSPDATGDPDGDGFTNQAEWLAGTDPLSAASYLKLSAISTGSGTVTLGSKRWQVAAIRCFRPRW
ncbi:MAG: lamin tail domain-containing protein [Verrucomicrobiota bacterium]